MAGIPKNTVTLLSSVCFSTFENGKTDLTSTIEAPAYIGKNTIAVSVKL